MAEPETDLIKSVIPRREWLLRCSDNNYDISMCSICVTNGTIEIVGPDNDVFMLRRSEIADFHSALHEAIGVAEADMRERA